MLHWIDCDIVYLCFHGSFSCCIGLIVTLFICVLMVLPHVALDCDSVYLCFYGSSSCCLGLIVISFFLCFHCSSSCCFGLILTLYICVLKSHPHVALD